MIKKTIVASALTFVFGLSVSYAQQAGDRQNPEHQSIFQRLDTDGDGKISKAEAAAAEKGHLKDKFDVVDTNHDGFITKEEMKIYRQNNPRPEHKKQ